MNARYWLVLLHLTGMINGCSNVHPATPLLPCDAGIIVFDGGMNTIDGGRVSDAGSMISHRDGGSESPVSAYRGNYGLTLWTEQTVREVYQTPSGWTLLAQDLAREDRSHEPPLQERYVSLFSTLEEMIGAATSAFPQVGGTAGSISVSTVWHMWADNDSWPERFRTAIARLQETGYQVRPVLLHKESYPANLHVSGNPSESGWANPNSVEQFLDYTDRVLETLAHTLTPGSTIYVSLEAESAIWEGMVGDGKWPPGATGNGYALARAFLNLRDALRLSATKISRYGFRPAVGVSVSPLLPGTHHEGEGLLEYLRTWWLADSLATGICASDRNPFDMNCTRHGGSVLNTVGITFYGGIWSHSHHVPFGLTGFVDAPLAMMVPSLQTDAALFADVLGTARTLYPHATIEVAEIGFSEARVDTQIKKLIDYKLVTQCKNISHTTLHTLFFGTTEFQQGDWQFGIVEDCSRDLECLLTERGRGILTELSYPPIPNPCRP